MSKATIAGIPLLAKSTVGWTQSQGFQPHMRVFQVHKQYRSQAEQAQRGECSLYFKRGSKTRTIKRLKILAIVPVDHPQRIGLRVSDCRWEWDYITVARTFNERRRSGEFRIVDDVLERVPPVDTITFAPYSLKNETTRWVADEAVIDVTNEVTRGKFSTKGADFRAKIDIDGLMFRDRGSSAMARVCAYIPGLTFFIDDDGIAQATLTSGGDEEASLARSGPPIVGPNLSAKVDMSAVRPSAVEAYFQPEDEARFDAIEGIATTTTSREPRTLDNVLRLPDTIKFVSGPLAGKTIVAGTWVPIDADLFNAWAQTPCVAQIEGRSKTLPPITLDIIRRLWLAPAGYHAYFEVTQPVWKLRWNALLAHFRQSYRLPRKWADRCHSFQPTRLAIQDPSRGTRAPPDIYADHCLIPPIQRIAFKQGRRAVENVLAWPLSDGIRNLADGTICSSVTMTVEDPDCFVFHLGFKPTTAQINNVQIVLPSAMAALENGDSDALPSHDPAEPLGRYLLQTGRLATRHRMTTVITLGSASPQGLKGLYKVTVQPDEAKAFLPAAISRNVGPCRGPVLQIFVGVDVCTARFAWKDSEASEIEACILDGQPRSIGRLLDPDHVRNVARSVAASVYSQYVDRWEGARVTDFDSAALPVGRISSVVHALTTKGVFTTARNMPADVQPIDFMGLLPEATRRQLFQKVQPVK